MRRATVLLLLSVLAGCKLVDQTTFDPKAGQGYVPPPAPAGPVPLVVLRLGAPDLTYAATLRQQVDLAVDRKPDVQFDVVTVVPAVGTPAQQTEAAQAVVADARDTARVISGEGVDDGQIHLLAGSEAGLTAREIRVYVR